MQRIAIIRKPNVYYAFDRSSKDLSFCFNVNRKHPLRSPGGGLRPPPPPCGEPRSAEFAGHQIDPAGRGAVHFEQGPALVDDEDGRGQKPDTHILLAFRRPLVPVAGWLLAGDAVPRRCRVGLRRGRLAEPSPARRIGCPCAAQAIPGRDRFPQRSASPWIAGEPRHHGHARHHAGVQDQRSKPWVSGFLRSELRKVAAQVAGTAADGLGGPGHAGLARLERRDHPARRAGQDPARADSRRLRQPLQPRQQAWVLPPQDTHEDIHRQTTACSGFRHTQPAPRQGGPPTRTTPIS